MAIIIQIIYNKSRTNTMKFYNMNIILPFICVLLLITPNIMLSAFEITKLNSNRAIHNYYPSIIKSKSKLYIATNSDTTTSSSSSNNNINNNNKSTINIKSSIKNEIGEFEEIDGNYLLRPPSGQQPRALIHFLGGAIVGASPHISYRYILEKLAKAGYLVIATPYILSFDHLKTCDIIINKFEKIAIPLARSYGALPVIGIGHSCGSLLHLLITSLFPDTPRAANALISFNNKPISEAVPFFEEFFTPFFTYVSAKNETNRQSGSEIILTGLELTKTAIQGELPSDELLSHAFKLLVPPGIQGGPFSSPLPIVLPGAIRTAFTTVSAPYTIALTEAGVVPIVTEVIDVLKQIPYLIDEVADGARDFTPPPALVKVAARRSYRARRTLLLQYIDDPIDESDEIEEILKAASQIIRMKRPMMAGETIDVQRRNLPGSHAAPLIAPPLDIAEQFESLLGQDVAKERLLYNQADQTVQEIIRWLEESNL